jgi:sodium-dependent dicarboxylate transporter 2/3/5
MPILASAAGASGVDPILLMAPGVIGASCGFMLPVATGPSTVAFGTGEIPPRFMARVGLALDLSSIVVTAGVCYLLFAPKA